MAMQEMTWMELEGSRSGAQAAEEAFHMDEQAFRVFYEKTARPLWSYLRRLSGNPAVADDMVQESYCRFLRASLKSNEEAYQRNYLFRIATNLMRDQWRRARPSEELSESAAGSLATRDRLAESTEQRSDLDRALAQLKPREREILWLAYVEGSSHKEIAAVVGVRAASVRLLLFRARRKMADLLRPAGDSTCPESVL